MYLEHNSQQIFFREPFGAAVTGQNVTLRLAMSGAGIPHFVKCMIYKKGELYLSENMHFVFSVCEKNIYSCTVEMPSSECILNYCFVTETDDGMFYYGNNLQCLGGLGKMYENEPNKKYQITVFQKDFKTPSWFKKSVFYQIFPDRFYNPTGKINSSRTDVIRRNWGDEPFYKAEQFGGEYLSNDFFGGTLGGIEEKLGYLKELGISGIYLNPIFEAFSNHRYDTGDYEKTDGILGSEEDFKSLCEKAREMGIRIVLDGVFNHTGSNSKYFNKDGNYDTLGAYQSEQSEYDSWYKFGENRDDYECWWGMKTLPHVNEESESYRKYILTDNNSIVKKWLKYGASGWRLDVVDELPDFFVKELRKSVKQCGEDNVVIGEVWEDASNKVSYGEQREYFLGKELDSAMNYPLRSAIVDFVTGVINSDEFSKRVMSLKENYPPEAFHACLNMLSSHDVERLINSVSKTEKPQSREEAAHMHLDDDCLESAKKRALSATALQMTLPGVPCVYYGDEIAMQGAADPFCRRCFEWDKVGSEYSKCFKELIDLRNSSNVFCGGELEFAYTIGGVAAFVRYNSEEKYIVAVNSNDFDEKIRLDAARFGINQMKNCFGDDEYFSDDGIFYLEVSRNGVIVLKAVR